MIGSRCGLETIPKRSQASLVRFVFPLKPPKHGTQPSPEFPHEKARAEPLPAAAHRCGGPSAPRSSCGADRESGRSRWTSTGQAAFMLTSPRIDTQGVVTPGLTVQGSPDFPKSQVAIDGRFPLNRSPLLEVPNRKMEGTLDRAVHLHPVPGASPKKRGPKP